VTHPEFIRAALVEFIWAEHAEIVFDRFGTGEESVEFRVKVCAGLFVG